jgi:hypothetical protein
MTDLARDLDLLRSKGWICTEQRRLPALARACSRLGFVYASGDPDVEGLVRAAVDDLGDDELGLSAFALFGLGATSRQLAMSVREEAAGRVLGVSQRQFQRTRRSQVLQAVARQMVARMTAQGPSVVSQSYRSPFLEWHEKSWVRRGMAQVQEFESNLDFFSRELVPVFDLSEAAQLSEEQAREIIVLWLYNYLDFTVQLEVGPVNYVCKRIHDASFLDWLPALSKDDALRIYTDEGGHAEMSNELSRRVQLFTGIEPCRIRPQFLVMLDELRRDCLPMERDFITLLFVIISETLITGTLSKLPGDATVQPAVRAVASDHASDERRHHAYFAQLLEMMWPRFPKPLRRQAVLLLPVLLHAFLDVDRQAMRNILTRFPSVFPEPDATITGLLSSDAVKRRLQESARPSISQLRKVGVLDEEAAIEVFAAAGFHVKDRVLKPSANAFSQDLRVYGRVRSPVGD